MSPVYYSLDDSVYLLLHPLMTNDQIINVCIGASFVVSEPFYLVCTVSIDSLKCLNLSFRIALLSLNLHFT